MSDNKKEKLLSEATIRRFQALANLDVMGEGGMIGYARDDELEDEEAALPGEEAPVDDMEAPVDDEVPGEEEDLEMGGEEDLGGLSPEAQAIADAIADPVVDAIASAISDSPDIDVQVSDIEGEEEPGLEEPGLEGPPPEAEVPEEDEDELALESVEVVDDDELVAEIARRVAKRLLGKD